MANPHKLWMFVGTVGAITGLFDLMRSKQMPDLTSEPPQEKDEGESMNTRDRLVAWAESHEGSSDSDYFWNEALQGANGPYPKDWCGAFVLAGLHHVQIATDRKWAIGKGLETTLPKLTRTKEPQPGDIAYFNAKQHVAIVLSVDGNNVTLANGNSVGNKVVIDVRPKSAVTTFYSIEPYILTPNDNEPLTMEVEP